MARKEVTRNIKCDNKGMIERIQIKTEERTKCFRSERGLFWKLKGFL